MIWHLACLALTGKIYVLKSYQDSITEGKLPEHLQKLDEELEEYVNHAVEFAEEHLKILNEREAAEAHLGPQALITFNKIAEQLKEIGWTVYCDKNYDCNAYFISKTVSSI